MVSPNDTFRELRVLKSPEAQETGLEEPIIGAIDVVLTVADRDQVRVLNIYIDRRHHAAFSVSEFECEEVLQVDLVF